MGTCIGLQNDGERSAGELLSSSIPRSRSSLCVGVVGAGALGGVLAVALHRAGYVVAALASRRAASLARIADLLPEVHASTNPAGVVARAHAVFLTVPDREIERLAATLPWKRGQIVAHCSGALGLEVLRSATDRGAHCAAFHPLCALPRHGRAALPRGVRFGFTGDASVRPWFQSVAEQLGGALVDVAAGDRALYHSAAVIASNYTVTLAGLARDLLVEAGVAADEALPALLPLLQSTLDNLAAAGLPGALTGPIVRGDLCTVERHRQALAGRAAAPVYDSLAGATALLALQGAGLPEADRAALAAISQKLPSSAGDRSR